MNEPILVHVGVRPENLLECSRALASPLLIRGDGWNAWNEPLGLAGNDGATLHALIHATRGEAEAVVLRLLPHLAPMDDATVVAVETPVDDWSVAETGGRIWHRIAEVTGATTLIVEYVDARRSR